jgi:catalase
MVEAGELGRYVTEQHAEDDDFGQAGTLVRDIMSATDRDHLAGNIVAHAGEGVSDDVQRRVVAYWTGVDADLGAQVAAGLGTPNGATTGNGASSDRVTPRGAAR